MATNRPEPNRKRPDKAPPAGVHAAAASGREISEQEARKEIWDEPGGEAMALRESKAARENQVGAGHDELTAAETPKTTRRLNDASVHRGRNGKPRKH